MRRIRLSNIDTAWVCLFGITLIVFFWFCGKVLLGAFDYIQFSEPVILKTVHWKVVETSPSRYQIEAAYSFNFNQKQYESRFLFKDRDYGNAYLAEEAIKIWQQRPPAIWINKQNPSLSMMNREFPFRDLIRAGLALAVFCYFIWLRQAKGSLVSEGK
ncbi:MAG: hypothetical protein HY860_02010 [Chlamydiales bacterium]|nr:hypothetical protein [Chlamydiales bacterium]